MCVQPSPASPGLFIHKGGRWLRLDASGRLQGERLRPRFFYLRRGQLKEARTRRVLRLLRSTRAIGPPLHSARRDSRYCRCCDKGRGRNARQRVVPPACPIQPAAVHCPKDCPSVRPATETVPHEAQKNLLALADAPSSVPSQTTPALTTSVPPEAKKPKPSISHDAAADRQSPRSPKPKLPKLRLSRNSLGWFLPSSSSNDSAAKCKPGPSSAKQGRKRGRARKLNETTSSSEELHTRIVTPTSLRRTRNSSTTKPTSSTPRQTRTQLRKSTSEETLDLMQSLKLMPVSQLSQIKSQTQVTNSQVLRKRPGSASSKPAQISSDEEADFVSKKLRPRRSTLEKTKPSFLPHLSSDESDFNTFKYLRTKLRNKLKRPGPLSNKTLRPKQSSPQKRHNYKLMDTSSDESEILPAKKIRSMPNSPAKQQKNKPPGGPGSSKPPELSSDVKKDTKEIQRRRSPSPCKELFITLQEVSSIARWLETWPRALPPHEHDAARFRTDEVYRGQVLFRLQPLVSCERLPLSQITSAALRAPARGELQTGDNSDSETEEESNKENRKRKRDGTTFTSESDRDSDTGKKLKEKREPAPLKQDSNNRPKNLVVISTSGSDTDSDSGKRNKDGKRPPALLKRDGNNQPKTTVKSHVFRRSRGTVPAHPRAFSPLEDRSMVSYILDKRLEHEVNGNGLWKRLQPYWKERCGVTRSWHSLRNRYLRYLLPSLHQLPLSAKDAQRLRAAAATGSLKLSRKRRNSWLQAGPAPPSAWSRRPRPRLADTPDRSPSAISPSVTRSGSRRAMDASR